VLLPKALINAQTSFAFKSFRTSPQTNKSEFQELINEMILLSHPLIREHPHIVRLEGICWDIPRESHISPVLVFEKAHMGDLDHFLTSNKGGDLSMKDRLNICVHIGIAVRDMHSNGMDNYPLRLKLSG
jgi:serine/threonine protein kinase